MTLDLDSLFYEDFYGATWEINTGEIRTITWSTEDYELQLPSGDYDTVTASLDNYIDDIRKAFEIWDDAIESISFVETSSGNSADVTIAATDIDGFEGIYGYWNYNWDENKHITEGTIRFDRYDLNNGWLLTTAMHEIGNILGLGDLPKSNKYTSVQEDPFPQMFNMNQLLDFDQQMIDILYPEYVDDINQDTDGDGFVDEVTNYQMWTASGGVDLTNRRGKTYSDNSSRMWNAIKAVETDNAFSVLVKGERKKDGKYKVVSANDEGVIGGVTRWFNGNQMFNEGYEELFAMDFNGNSQIGF